MRNKRISEMAISAIFFAIIGVMTFVPYTGYITVGPVQITTLHIVVLLAGMLFGWKIGLVAGTSFGLWCLFKAACFPTAVTDPIFVNPLISVVPRILLGLVGGLLYQVEKKIPNVGLRSVIYIITTAFMTLFHTAIVLLTLWLFASKEVFGDNFKAVISAILCLNTLIEVISACVVIPTISLAVGKAKPKYNPYEKVEVWK